MIELMDDERLCLNTGKKKYSAVGVSTIIACCCTGGILWSMACYVIGISKHNVWPGDHAIDCLVFKQTPRTDCARTCSRLVAESRPALKKRRVPVASCTTALPVLHRSCTA